MSISISEVSACCMLIPDKNIKTQKYIFVCITDLMMKDCLYITKCSQCTGDQAGTADQNILGDQQRPSETSIGRTCIRTRTAAAAVV